MSNYNIAQKLLLVLGLFVFIAFIFGTLYILTEPKQPNVLGASTDGVNSENTSVYTAQIKVFKDKSSETKTIADAIETKNLYFNNQLSQILFDEDTYVVSSNFSGFFTKYNVYAESGTFYFQNGSESWNLLTKDTAIRVLPYSQVFVDATKQEFIVAYGSVLYEESNVLESGQRLSYIVDNEYIYDDGSQQLEDKFHFRDLGYNLFDIRLLPENLDLMSPEVVY